MLIKTRKQITAERGFDKKKKRLKDEEHEVDEYYTIHANYRARKTGGTRETAQLLQKATEKCKFLIVNLMLCGMTR